jgi:mono/diheme cytochrome c family protein
MPEPILFGIILQLFRAGFTTLRRGGGTVPWATSYQPMEGEMSASAVIRMPGEGKEVTLAGKPMTFLVTGADTKHTSMFDWTWEVGMVRLGMTCLTLVAATMGNAYAQSPLVQRGDYLVNTIMTCGNCHTPKGPPAAIAGKDFSGGLSWDEPPFKVTASNSTPDKETGIGSWSDTDIKKLLRTGEQPNGVHIAMVMPTGFYHIMTEGDVNAVVAYLHTLKPVSNKVADPIYKMPQLEMVLPGAEKPYTEAMMGDKVKKGFYLATIGHCMECHTPMGPHGREWADHLGAGGFKMPGPWGVSVSRNITSSKTKGLGAWSDDEIKRAITQGISRDGSKLNPPMGFGYYAKMTPDDLDAIVAWLRTVPAQE